MRRWAIYPVNLFLLSVLRADESQFLGRLTTGPFHAFGHVILCLGSRQRCGPRRWAGMIYHPGLFDQEKLAKDINED